MMWRGCGAQCSHRGMPRLVPTLALALTACGAHAPFAHEMRSEPMLMPASRPPRAATVDLDVEIGSLEADLERTVQLAARQMHVRLAVDAFHWNAERSDALIRDVATGETMTIALQPERVARQGVHGEALGSWDSPRLYESVIEVISLRRLGTWLPQHPEISFVIDGLVWLRSGDAFQGCFVGDQPLLSRAPMCWSETHDVLRGTSLHEQHMHETGARQRYFLELEETGPVSIAVRSSLVFVHDAIARNALVNADPWLSPRYIPRPSVRIAASPSTHELGPLVTIHYARTVGSNDARVLQAFGGGVSRVCMRTVRWLCTAIASRDADEHRFLDAFRWDRTSIAVVRALGDARDHGFFLERYDLSGNAPTRLWSVLIGRRTVEPLASGGTYALLRRHHEVHLDGPGIVVMSAPQTWRGEVAYDHIEPSPTETELPSAPDIVPFVVPGDLGAVVDLRGRWEVTESGLRRTRR